MTGQAQISAYGMKSLLLTQHLRISRVLSAKQGGMGLAK